MERMCTVCMYRRILCKEVNALNKVFEAIASWWEWMVSIAMNFQFKDAVDIIIVAFLIYGVVKLVRETRAGQLVKGLFLLVILFIISSYFNLVMVSRVLAYFFQFAFVAILIVFQPEIRKALDAIDPTIFIYGEGWAAKAPKLPEAELAMKNNVYQMPGIAAFSDEFRDSLRGPFGNDDKGAFIIGRLAHEIGVKFGIVGGIAHPQINNDSVRRVPKIWANTPSQFISYASCHDDLCLTDRLKATLPGASIPELKALQKLTETAVLTSQGVPFIFAGDEILRDKKGVANSYNQPDNVNAIDWRNKTTYREVFDYVRGLISMRKAHPAFRMGDPELIRKHLEFIYVPATNVVAFRIKGSPCGDKWLNTIVVLNARTEPIKVNIPEGKYWIACRDGKIDLVLGLGIITGNQITVSPRSAMIIHQ